MEKKKSNTRFQIYDRKTRKYVYKTYSNNKYTTEEIEKLSKEWLSERKKLNEEYIESLKIDPKKDPEVERITNEDNVGKIKGAEFPPDIKDDVDLILDEGTGNSILILGASKRGKSTLLMHLYHKYFEDYIAVLFTDNPQINIYGDKKIILSSAFSKDPIEIAKVINQKTDNEYKFMFILDDIIDQKEDKILSKLILTYRNSDISSMISLQNAMLFKKSSRDNVHNYIFFGFGTDDVIEDVIKKFFNSYLGDCTMTQKIQWYKDMTKDHRFIYYSPRKELISFHKLTI